MRATVDPRGCLSDLAQRIAGRRCNLRSSRFASAVTWEYEIGGPRVVWLRGAEFGAGANRFSTSTVPRKSIDAQAVSFPGAFSKA